LRGQAAFPRSRARPCAQIVAPSLEASWGKVGTRLGEAGRLWIAYPKSGKLGTDLNRDILAELIRQKSFDPVRQVAIDDTWSALWFKPIE
jgi:hypothetical protein